MRKQTKLVAVLSAAALLAIGATMTASAATAGWTDQDGVWVYLDTDGERVTNEWKKSNNAWYYLDDNGEMSVDTWIDGDFYVGTDGKMITNNWALLVPEEADTENPDDDGEKWFYFDSKGKKTSTDSKTISGKVYFFDTDGAMREDWHKDDDGNIYYLGSDGARKSGWVWLEADTEEDGVDESCELCDEEGWYYFENNGKLFNKGGAKKINGKYYYFNNHGQMLYNWVVAGTDSNAADDDNNTTATIDEMKYAFNVDKGNRVDGWLKVDGSYAVGTQDDNNWYYFKKGEAKYADAEWTISAGTLGTDLKARNLQKIKVDGKDYCFDAKGKMKTGLQAIGKDSEYDTYYFDENGVMKTGRISNVEEDNGDTAVYYFATTNANKGKGITGAKDGYLYNLGKRVEASDDYKFYEVDDNIYLVNGQ